MPWVVEVEKCGKDALNGVEASGEKGARNAVLSVTGPCSSSSHREQTEVKRDSRAQHEGRSGLGRGATDEVKGRPEEAVQSEVEPAEAGYRVSGHERDTGFHEVLQAIDG